MIDVIFPCLNDTETLRKRNLKKPVKVDGGSDSPPDKCILMHKLRKFKLECDSIFLVFDVSKHSDMKQLIATTVNGTRYDEENIVVIMYNSLLCLKYLH